MAGVRQSNVEMLLASGVTISQFDNQTNKTKMKESSAALKTYKELYADLTEQNNYLANDVLMLSEHGTQSHYTFLRTLLERAVTGSPEEAMIRQEMEDVLAIMRYRVKFTKEILGLEKSTVYQDGVIAAITANETGLKPAKKQEDKKVKQLVPDADSPAAKEAAKVKKDEKKPEAKAEATPKEEPKKETDVASGEPMAQIEITKRVKEIYLEKGVDAAREFAAKYFATGNYIPKKDHAKPEKWEEPRINNWIKSVLQSVKETPKTDNKDIKPPVDKTPKPAEKKDNKEAGEKKTVATLSTDKKGEEKKEGTGPSPETLLQNHRALRLMHQKIEAGELENKLNNEALNDAETVDKNLVDLFEKGFIPEGSEPSVVRHKIMRFTLPADSLVDENIMLTTLAKRYIEESNKKNEPIAKGMVTLFFRNRGYKEHQMELWLKGVKNSGLKKIEEFSNFNVLTLPSTFHTEKKLGECALTEQELLDVLNNEEAAENERHAEIVSHVVGNLVKVNGVFYATYTDNHADLVINALKESVEMEKTANTVETYSLEHMETLVQAAVKAGTSQEDFITQNKDLVLKPNGEWRTLSGEKEVIDLDEGEFKTFVSERYEVYVALEESEAQAEEGTEETADEVLDERIVVMGSNIEAKIREAGTIEKALEIAAVKDGLENGIIVNYYDDVDSDSEEIHSYTNEAESIEAFKEFIQTTLDTPAPEKSELPDAEEGETVVDAETNINQPADEESADEPETNEEETEPENKEENEEEPTDEPEASDAEQAEEEDPPFVPDMTQEQADQALATLLKDEKTTFQTCVDSYKGMVMKMTGQEADGKEAWEYVRGKAKEIAPEKLDTLKKADEKKPYQKIYLESPFSKKYPEAWEEYQNIKDLASLKAACEKYNESDNFNVALSLALEVVKSGNISETHIWDKKKVTDWLKSEIKTAESKETKGKAVAVPKEFIPIQQAGSPKALNKAVSKILQNCDDEKEARVNIIQAIKVGTGRHIRKIKNLSDSELDKLISTIVDNSSKVVAAPEVETT